MTAPMHKKLKKWVIAAAALVTVAAVGVTLAFMFKKANVKNTFVPAEVSCTAYEKLDGEDITEATAKGGEKSDIRVENTGKVNEYLRVRLVSYFADAEGNVTGAEPSVYPDITLNDGWIAGSNHTYYYTGAGRTGRIYPRDVPTVYACGKRTAGRNYDISGRRGICRGGPGRTCRRSTGSLGRDR